MRSRTEHSATQIRNNILFVLATIWSPKIDSASSRPVQPVAIKTHLYKARELHELIASMTSTFNLAS